MKRTIWDVAKWWGVVLFCGWITLAHAAESSEGKARQIILVLGDSIAAGYGLDPTNAYPAVLQRTVDAAKLPFRVVNGGLSGDTTAGGVRRVDWMMRGGVDVLVLELGGNDGLRGISPKVTQANLEAIIKKVRTKNPSAAVILAGMKMPANMGEYAAQFEKVFSEVARSQGVELIPFVLEGVAGVPDLNLPDMIHPTAEGQKRVAANVWKTLESVLQKRVAGGVGETNRSSLPTKVGKAAVHAGP